MEVFGDSRLVPDRHSENLIQRVRSRLHDAALTRGDPVGECHALAQVRHGFQFTTNAIIHSAVASQFDLLVRLSRIGKQRDIADCFLGCVLNIGIGINVAHAM